MPVRSKPCAPISGVASAADVLLDTAGVVAVDGAVAEGLVVVEQAASTTTSRRLLARGRARFMDVLPFGGAVRIAGTDASGCYVPAKGTNGERGGWVDDSR